QSAIAALDGGGDALSLINTLIGMSVNINTRRPRLSNITGGLSGPAIRPIGVAMTWKVRKAVGSTVPVFGIGGIMDSRDALEYIIAGANAVQIGTGTFLDPKTAENVLNGIKAYLAKESISKYNNLVGALNVRQI
ncbi:MAG: dihydroorotate dehydrogenase, partial [bacterium]